MEWEYKVFKSTESIKEEEVLNEFGQEGWELVTVDMDISSLYYYFKRAVSKTLVAETIKIGSPSVRTKLPKEVMDEIVNEVMKKIKISACY